MASIHRHPNSKFWYCCINVPGHGQLQRTTKHTDRRKALEDFVKSGKGLWGCHASADAYHSNQEYRFDYDDLIGASFSGHPWGKLRLRVDDFRVFYDVTENRVTILGIVPKSRAEQWLKEKGKL